MVIKIPCKTVQHTNRWATEMNVKYTLIEDEYTVAFKIINSIINKGQRIPKGQSKIGNSEKLATQSTEDQE